MSKEQEQGDSIFDHLTNIRTTDPVILRLMQSLGIETGVDSITLNQDEQARLEEIKRKIREEEKVGQLINDILSELPDISDEQLTQILSFKGITDPDLVRFAIHHCHQSQLFMDLKPLRHSDPQIIKLLEDLGIQTK